METKYKLEQIRSAESDGKLTLNNWEASFIDNIFENYRWTAAQEDRIDNIHDRIG